MMVSVDAESGTTTVGVLVGGMLGAGRTTEVRLQDGREKQNSWKC